MRLRIGIAGAGIGGLAAAGLLAQAGHAVTVFDQFEAPRPVGSGLVIQPVGQRVLVTLGAWEAARALGAPLRAMFGHEAERARPVLNVTYERRGDRAFGLAIHRASLFQAILERALALGVRLEPGAPVRDAAAGMFTLEGGRKSARFDLAVDAAGAGSALSPLVARPLPYGAVWGAVDWPADTPLPRDELRQVYRRADRMIGVMPMGRLPGGGAAKAAIFWLLPRDAHRAWAAAGLAAWRNEATALWPEFAPFAAQITDPEQMTMARYTHGTLRNPVSRGLVHIGDAAHRASPQLGQGANMALLDALALARAVAVHPGDMQTAARAYARARRWHVRLYQAMSALFTPQYQSDSRALPVLRDRVVYPLSRIAPVPGILTALVRGDLIAPVAGPA